MIALDSKKIAGRILVSSISRFVLAKATFLSLAFGGAGQFKGMGASIFLLKSPNYVGIS